MLSLALLGSPQILLDGRSLDSLRRKNRGLVFYLAAHPAPVTRDHLLTFFWPDHARPAAQQILRTMLHDLRRQLGPALSVDEDRLSLTPETDIDVRQFEAGLAATPPNPGRLAHALALYRGDFLDGFSLADTPDFDDWAVAQRERLRLQAIRGLTALAGMHEAEHNFSAALDDLNWALRLDPLQEDLQRTGLRLHYLNGDRVGAIRRYEALRKMLLDEMGVPPMPETQALYDVIIADAPDRVSLQPARPAEAQRSPAPARALAARLQPDEGPLLPFTGRAGELRALAEAASAGKMILIEGEPGVGKSRLAEEWIASRAHSAAANGGPPLVLRGTAHELEQGLPYQPVIDALRGLLAAPDWPALRAGLDLAPAWLAEVARLLPDLQAQYPGLPETPALLHEARLWEAFNQLVQHLARRRPVILFVDDLQWADPSTIGWIGYLVRHTAPPGILIVATARPVETHAPVAQLAQALTHENRLARLPLLLLSASAMTDIAAHLSPAQPRALADWLAGVAEGNPYFLTELIRFAYRSGFLGPDGTFDQAALAVAPILPPSIRNLIESRFIHLSATARRILDVAAVLGREFEVDLISRSSAFSEDLVVDALDELHTAGVLLRGEGGRFAFDHSLTMQVALAGMGEARSRLLHRRVAETLEDLYRPRLDPVAGSIAQHFTAARAPDRAAPYAFRAGRFAAGLAAWAEAITFYEASLEAETDLGRRTAILLALGEACFHRGDFARASDTLQAAAKLAGAQGDLASLEAAHLALNLSLIPQARFAEAAALARELRASGPPDLAVCAEFLLGATLGIESAHPLEAERHVREAERLLNQPRSYPSRINLAHLRYQMAGIKGQQGDSAEAVALYRAALELAREDEAALDILRRIMLFNNLAYHLGLLGDPAAAGYARSGIELAREKGSLTHLPYLLSTSGEIALDQGDLTAAERYFEEGLSLARQIPVLERVAGLTANLGRVAQAQGRAELARERLSDALQQAEALDARHLAVRVRVWLAPLLPPPEARQCLAQGRATATESGFQSLLEEIARQEQRLTAA